MSATAPAGPEAAGVCPAPLGHYGVGALTEPYPYPAYGSYGWRVVSNPQPGPYSQCDTIFATAHMGDNSGNCPIFQAEYGTSSCWTELGWMESVEADIPCKSLQIYTFNSARAQGGGEGYYCFGSEYPIAPGNAFEFAILTGAPPYNYYWYDEIYWNGAWQLLDWAVLSTPYTAYPGTPNNDIETSTNYDSDGYYMSVPETWSENDQVETSPGSWQLWTQTAVPGSAIFKTVDDEYGNGYYAAAYSPIYTWWGCGPVYHPAEGGSC